MGGRLKRKEEDEVKIALIRALPGLTSSSLLISHEKLCGVIQQLLQEVNSDLKGTTRMRRELLDVSSRLLPPALPSIAEERRGDLLALICSIWSALQGNHSAWRETANPTVAAAATRTLMLFLSVSRNAQVLILPSSSSSDSLLLVPAEDRNVQQADQRLGQVLRDSVPNVRRRACLLLPQLRRTLQLPFDVHMLENLTNALLRLVKVTLLLLPSSLHLFTCAALVFLSSTSPCVRSCSPAPSLLPLSPLPSPPSSFLCFAHDEQDKDPEVLRIATSVSQEVYQLDEVRTIQQDPEDVRQAGRGEGGKGRDEDEAEGKKVDGLLMDAQEVKRADEESVHGNLERKVTSRRGDEERREESRGGEARRGKEEKRGEDRGRDEGSYMFQIMRQHLTWQLLRKVRSLLPPRHSSSDPADFPLFFVHPGNVNGKVKSRAHVQRHWASLLPSASLADSCAPYPHTPQQLFAGRRGDHPVAEC
eukprot:238085-Hanusia_phi.AAC.5